MALFKLVDDYDVADFTFATDQLAVALSNTAPSDETLNPTTTGNSQLANVTQIAYTNVSSRNITTTSWDAGTNTLILEDLLISASGGVAPDFRYIYIYDDTTVGDQIIGYFDLGKSFSLAEWETITLNFDSTGGLFNGSTSIIPNETLSRSISSLIKTALTQTNIEVFWLTELKFDSPNDIYMWNGIGELTLDGTTYTGLGDLLSISELRESSDIAAYGATLTLSGIPTNMVNLALQEPYQGRRAIVKFGVKSQGKYSVATVYTGEMDQMNINYGPQSVTISLDVESRLVDLQRARIRRYTNADQQLRFDGDLAFEFVPRLQNESLEWA